MSEPTPVTVDEDSVRSLSCPVARKTNSVGIAAFQPLRLPSDGVFRFEVRREGYSSALGFVRFTAELTAITAEVRLQSMSSQSFSAEGGLMGMELDGVSVRVAPDSLVYEGGIRAENLPDGSGTYNRDLKGVPVTGMVRAELAVVHPSTIDGRALPGPMYGLGVDGATTPLFSGGMLEFRMSQDGIPVQPRPGAAVQLSVHAKDLSAEVRTEMEAQLQKTGVIPKWSLDPETGLWREEGSWLVEKDEQGGFVFTTLQDHFTWINVDCPGNLYCQMLEVIDGEGKPMPDLPVYVVNGWHDGATGPDGTICAESPGPTTLHVCGQDVVMPVSDGQEISACVDSQNAWLGENPPSGLCDHHKIKCLLEPICVPHSYRVCAKSNGTGGICEDAKQYCIDGWEWSDCPDPINKGMEVCAPLGDNATALDEDCDGKIDEEGKNCGCTDQQEPCYKGPESELTNGCKAGLQQCNQGEWGACEGATTPQVEDCSTAVDENCDGAKPQCVGGAIWAVKEDAPGFDIRGDAVAVTADAMEDVMVGMTVTRRKAGALPMKCNNDPNKKINVHTDLDQSDVLIARYAEGTGMRMWVRRIGGEGDQRVHDIATIKDGLETLVLGDFTGTLDADDCGSQMCKTQIVSDGAGPHLFLAKFGPDGECLTRVQVTSGVGTVQNPRLVLQGASALIVATAAGKITLVDKGNVSYDAPTSGKETASGLLMSTLIDVNPIGRVESDAVRGITSATNLGMQTPQAIALLGDRIAVAGSFTEAFGNVNVGGGPGSEVFVRTYDGIKDPEPTDHLLPATLGDQFATSVGFGPNGEMIVGGYFSDNSSVFGCEPDSDNGGFIAFDVKKSGNDTISGPCVGLRSPNQDIVRHFVTAPGGDLVVAATKKGSMGNIDVMNADDSEDCGLPYSGQGLDGIVFRLGSMTNTSAPPCRWATLFPEALKLDKQQVPIATDSDTEQTAWRVAASSKGMTFVTGRFRKSIGFLRPAPEGPTNVPGDTTRDSAYVVKLSP